MLSPTGTCYAFDHRANGYVRGEGAGVIVMKPLDQALADGNRIHAVIRAAVVNQDGHSSSLTVPNAAAQEAMLRDAYQQAHVDPRHVAYVEAHGTGTPVGDPIEAHALGHVFGEHRSPDAPCLIGSVKTNIGHLESASGMAGLIKACLILRHEVIPPHLNYEQANPNIPMQELGLQVTAEALSLPRHTDSAPIIGVNSFGFGGTNAHVVLEQAPSLPAQSDSRQASSPILLPLSAASEPALQAQAERYLSFLAATDVPVHDVAAAAGTRRDHLSHRLVITGEDRDQLRARLLDYLNQEDESPAVIKGLPSAEPSALVFVFTGQGAQWWGMGQRLMQRSPVFRHTIEAVDALFQPLSGWSLIEEMTRDEQHSRIHDTDVAQPAIFALQAALVGMWAEWGIRPAKVIGHSVGEVAAAYATGNYSLPDAVSIIYHRSRLQHQTGGSGAMIAVGISAAEARHLIRATPHVDISAWNSPSMITLSGEAGAISQLTAELEAAGKFVRRLPIHYAFHSYQMEAIHDELVSALAHIRPMLGTIPFVSTVTGGVIAGETMDAAYWWRNVREPVRFAEAISGLIQGGETSFLELGPHPALQLAIKDCLTGEGQQGAIFHSLRRDMEEFDEMLASLAALHVYGLPVNWAAVNSSDGLFVELPTYAWQPQSYRMDSKLRRQMDLEPVAHPLLGTRLSSPRPTWQSEMDPRVLGWLTDHKLWDSIVFPAAGYAEMSLAASRILFPDDSYVVEALQMKRALFVSTNNLPTLQTVFDESDKSISIYSRVGDSDDWQLHAQGYLRKLAPLEAPTIDLAAIQAGLPFLGDGEAFYQASHAVGYQWGPDFQHIANIWAVRGEALAELRVSERVVEQSADYYFHPAVLDACGQTLSAAGEFIHYIKKGEGIPFLPASYARIRLIVQPLPSKFWVHVTTVEQSDFQITATFRLYDDSGKQVAEILNFRFDRVTQGSLLSREGGAQLYQFQWQPTPLNDAPASGGAAFHDTSAGTVLLFADQQGVASKLGEALRQAGARVITAAAGSEFTKLNLNTYSINPGDEADLRHLLDAVQDDDSPLIHIVDAWALDQPAADSLLGEQMAEAQHIGVVHALRLAHALNLPRPPQVTFLTRDTHAVLKGDCSDGLPNAPLVGFLRVANNEMSAYRWRLIDLDAACPPDEVYALLNEIAQPDDELEIAYRNGQRFANRLMPIKHDALPPIQHPAARADGNVVPFRLQINKPGLLSNLSLNQTNRRRPSPHEIEVRVQAGGLNFRDVMKTLGVYPGNPIDLLWLGDDFAGTVIAVGDQVVDYQPGDAVVGLAPYAFQSHVTVDQRAVFRMPDHFSFAEAATIPTVFLTAYYAIVHLARMRPGERILIHAAAGGVGQAAIQIAEDLGLEIYATAGTPEKRALLQDQAIEYIFDSRTLDFADDILRVTGGQGVDAVLNSLAGDFIPKNFSVLAPFGRYLEIGKIDVYANSRIGLEALRNNISVFIIDLAQMMTHRPAEFAEIRNTLREKLDRKVYRPIPHTIFPISDAVGAFRHMAGGKHIGKNVLCFEADDLAIGRITENGRLFRLDASYLIAGGAGGFGLEVAKWMAQEGARHLVLMTRSGPPDAVAQADIDKLRESGIEVVDARGDLNRRDDVERVIDTIQQGTAPLAGVVHSAMVLHDEMLATLDEQHFNMSFHPKMLGAWNLHQATLAISLDHFICFSSISSIIGTSGQANYCAGNAFLDVLASYRRARGLPALTINWGVLVGAGYIARNEDAGRYLETVGVKGIPIPAAIQHLQAMLPLDSGQIAIAAIEWGSLRRYLYGMGSSNVFKYLTANDNAGGGDSAILTQLAAALPAERAAIIEGFLSRVIANILNAPIEQIDRSASLTQFGLDSLMAIELLTSMNNQLNLSLTISDVLSSTTIRDVAALAVRRISIVLDSAAEGSIARTPSRADVSGLLAQADQHFDLTAEAQLDPAIYPAADARPPTAQPEAVLLTGATGFLGAFLLADLLEKKHATIYCLIRGVDSEEGMRRLRDNLAQYGLWQAEFEHRIWVMIGDLAAPHFGLTDDAYQSLADQIDIIYHNGAQLNLIQPYHVLKATNVGGVEEVLRLASITQIKPVHYISTIAVFFGAGATRDRIVRETDQPEPRDLLGGYMQSKWVAEQLVMQAHERGIPCTIYRPGIITGHSQTGATNTEDLATRLVKGSYQLGMMPDRNMSVNIVPVDYVSRGIVHLSLLSEAAGETFHLTSPQSTPIHDLVTWASDTGNGLREVSYGEWRTALIKQAQGSLENALVPLLPMFPIDRPEQIEQLVDCQRTVDILARAGIYCPPIDAGLVSVYTDYLRESGHMTVNV